jgi:hypothetical protein
MREEPFREWLAQKFDPTVAGARFSNCRTIEKYYGDLDASYDNDRLASVVAELMYSINDERAGRVNPSKVPIDGNIRNGLATLKSAVKLYTVFRQRDPELAASGAPDADSVSGEPQRIGLGRDLQIALRGCIEHLEPGLNIIDGGSERSVEAGFIDITARDGSGALVVIELKAGPASARAVSQVLAYMGDVSQEEDGAPVRGIIVASEFDHKAQSAARMVPNLELYRYGVTFTFSGVGANAAKTGSVIT